MSTSNEIPAADKGDKQSKKDFVYANKAQTSIYLEQACEQNPYIASSNFLHGYDVVELIQKKSFVSVLLLLFTGELPAQHNVQLLERLMIALLNLGPRHPAVKASMVAGVSKANVEHLLPIGLSVLGGAANGAKEVEQAMLFIQKYSHQAVNEVHQELGIERLDNDHGEMHVCPGFGSHYGGIDVFALKIASTIIADNADIEQYKYISWAQTFAQSLAQYDMGWLKTGIAAAVFCELGIGARESVGLFQLICAPGIFAHGVEQTHKPITAIPMLSDEQHIYKP